MPYHFIALRRVFGGTRARTFWKGLAIGVVYWLVIAGVMLALALMAMRSLR